jgi:hypothetical protein
MIDGYLAAHFEDNARFMISLRLSDKLPAILLKETYGLLVELGHSLSLSSKRN